MQYFKIEGTITNNAVIEESIGSGRRGARSFADKMAYLTSCFNQKHEEAGAFAISSISEEHMQLCAVALKYDFVEKNLHKYLSYIKINLDDIYFEEIVYSVFENMLHVAYREDYIGDDSEIKSKAGLDDMTRRWGRGTGWDENLLEDLDRKAADEASSAFLGRSIFSEELTRIYDGKDNVKIKGHPVHYFIQTNNRESRSGMYRTLLGALYNKGRIHNRRYTYVDISGHSDIDVGAFESIYHAAAGGCMIIRYRPISEEESNYASSERWNIEYICSLARRYRHSVLTIICMPLECNKTKDIFYENLDKMCFVELKEDLAYGPDAKSYLKYLTVKNNIRSDSKLMARVEKDKGYSSIELRHLFEDWYDLKLRNNYYPQYKTTETVQKKIKDSAPAGSAYDRLQKMIGLDSAKKVMEQALDYYKAQKIFKDRGMAQNNPTMHMCFTGDPGTAKTSVARLFAEIMKENGLLSKGQLIECGRQDLVGRYVGWTAPAVQKKFMEAKGGVLFIDEAYSLVDDRDGSFGDEAISAIVAEMENHRDEVVVIFAGYSDKMESFLKKNPGLRSRIAFHVPFENYDSKQLCGIAGLIAGEKGMKISVGAESKLEEIFESARKQSDFGNGRFARNIIEKARMAQCSRLVRMDLDKITDEDLTTIIAEDIEAPVMGSGEAERHIGFCA